MGNRVLTFRDGQKPNQNQSILVSSPDVVTCIADREVDRVVFVLAGCNGNGCFVAPEYDRNEDGSMCIWIEGNNILSNRISACFIFR